jgi:CubicO group peptidase (beta-lactamase class C family)
LTNLNKIVVVSKTTLFETFSAEKKMRIKAITRKQTVRVLLGWIFIVSISLTYPIDAQDQTPKVDEYMDAVGRVYHFSGTVLLTRDGHPLISRSYGLANFELEVANTPKTKFRIGSMTKQFTAISILMLQERGKLSVTDSICKYIPECPQKWQEITIHQLLTHTSGIHEYLRLREFQQRALPLPVATVIKTLKNKPLDFKSGQKFDYSNSGYYLAGYIIERVSGKTYPDFLQENIFMPLGMSDTGYDRFNQVVPNRASGYSVDASGKIMNAAYLDMTIPFAAGGLYSTAEDLSKWDAALYTERLVSRKSFEAAHNSSVAASVKSLTGKYGYGWLTMQQVGRPAQVHGGEINGFTSFLARFPEEHATVIVLSNFDNMPVEMIARDLAAIMFGEKYELPQVRRVVQLDPRLFDLYAGQYALVLAPTITFAITNEGGKLMAVVPGQPKTELTPSSQTEFFVPGVNAQLRFIMDNSGQVTGLVLNQNGREIQAKKIK